MEVMAVWGLWMLCCSSLLASAVRSELSIRGCEHGIVDAVEDTDQFFTCGEYWIHGPQWTIYNDEGEKLYSGSCSNGSCTPSNNQFRLNELNHEKRNLYTTRLTIKKITRDSARKLICNNSPTRASCDLRITVPPLYKAGICNVSISNWMVTGKCTLRRMFSSDNSYTCGWTENDNEKKFGSFQIVPYNYNLRNSGRYIDGVCFFTKTMPVDDGHYTYSMKVSTGAGDFFSEALYIAKPHPVKVNHSCPSHVLEGSDVSCKCFAQTTGSPPAQIEWDGGNSATLLLKAVSRKMNEDQFTCRMKWGPNGFINESISFNLNVAYGPSKIVTYSSTQTSDEKPQSVLKCTAEDVYPSAKFHWNISCDNETYTVNTSTCILCTARVQDGMTVVCTASNQIFKNVSLSGFFVLNIPKNNGPEKIIGGVVAAAAIVAVSVALIAAYHVKRRNINKTETPVVGYSGDANSDEYVTLREKAENRSRVTEICSDHQARQTHQHVNQREEKAKNPAEPKLSSTGNEESQDLSEAATNSGFGVYHTVRRAAMFGTNGFDTRATDIAVVSEDEYNVLRFQKDRLGQDDHAATYSHLDLK